MEKKELITKLRSIKRKFSDDPEVAHGEADDALLEYINDKTVKKAYDNIKKWYA